MSQPQLQLVDNKDIPYGSKFIAKSRTARGKTMLRRQGKEFLNHFGIAISTKTGMPIDPMMFERHLVVIAPAPDTR